MMMRRSFPGAGVLAAAVLAAATLGVTGCGPQPTYQVVQSPAVRVGTVESVREVVEQAPPSGAGLIVGALAGGGLGSLSSAAARAAPSPRWSARSAARASATRSRNRRRRWSHRIGVKYDDGDVGDHQPERADRVACRRSGSA